MKKSVILALTIWSLGGCSSAQDLLNNDNSSGPPSLEITSFSVTSTSGATENVAAINPAENDGSFQLSWSASASNTEIFSTHVYLDDDPDFESDGDVFLDNIVYIGYIPTVHSTSELVTCNYGNDLRITCQDHAKEENWSDTNIEDFLETVPQNAYFILRICSMHTGDSMYCKIESYEIELQ